mgnify:FL=1
MQTRIGSLVSTLLLIATSNAAESAKFASGIVDIGMVAKDLEKTAKFYTEVVGLKEVKGFCEKILRSKTRHDGGVRNLFIPPPPTVWIFGSVI